MSLRVGGGTRTRTSTETGNRKLFRVGLKAKILVFVLVCVVAPLLVLGGQLLGLNQGLLAEKVRETLSNQLFRKTSQLDDWMRERQRDAARWSVSFVVYEAVEALSRPGADSVRLRRDLRDYLDSVLGHYQVYESLFIVDLQGEVLAGTRDERLETWGVKLLGGRGTIGVFSPLHRSEYIERPTLLVVQPIQDRHNRTGGYFVERIDLRELESLLASSEGGSAFWLLDEAGYILARSGRIVDQPGAERFSGHPIAAEPGEQIRDETLPGLGRTVFGLSSLRGPFRGHLVASLPASRAYQPLDISRRRLIGLGMPALVAIFAFNFLATRRLIAPIHRLSDGAKRVAGGDLDVYLPASGSDEIADLTRAFNDMAQRLREGRQHLEETRDELFHANEGLKAANRTLEALAITDGLTGLFNHRHFQETIDKEIRRCEREGRMLSLLMLDLDHFKQYNDRFGHTEGDSALRRVAGQILKSIRSTDMAFRYGGEEMALLLPSCTKTQAVEVAEKIRMAVARSSQRPSRFGARITVSIGVATFPDDGRVGRALLDMADSALYAAKAAGRDRVVASGSFPLPAPRSESAG